MSSQFEVTYAMIKDVLKRLTEDRPRLAPLTLWRAYAHLDDYKGSNPASDLTALVALIRRVRGLDETLTRHSGAGEKFTKEQMDWLRMIRDHLATSFTIERDDLEMAPSTARAAWGRCSRSSETAWTRL